MLNERNELSNEKATCPLLCILPSDKINDEVIALYRHFDEMLPMILDGFLRLIIKELDDYNARSLS